MSFKEREDLAIAYLLNELSEEQRTEFEERMKQDGQLARFVDELEESMGLTLMAESELIEPDLDLKDRLLAAVPNKSGSPGREDKVTPFPWLKVSFAVVGWAAAAILVFVLTINRSDLEKLRMEHREAISENEALQDRVEDLSNSVETLMATNDDLLNQIQELSENNAASLALNQQLQSTLDATLTQNENLESTVDSAQQANDRLRSEMEELSTRLALANAEQDNLRDRVTNLRRQSVLDKIQIASLSSEVDELRYGFAVWDNENDKGIVKVFNLDSLDISSQDYQFWVISPERETPIPAGVFQVDALGRAEYSFAPSVAVSNVGAFAISLEPKGGSAAPTGPIVLSGAL